jgi:hypothetical protein
MIVTLSDVDVTLERNSALRAAVARTRRLDTAARIIQPAPANRPIRRSAPRVGQVTREMRVSLRHIVASLAARA